MRIVVAMSGGVDSSVAAALLAEQGHDVIGLSMQLYDQTEGQTSFGSCCSIDDLHDARRVAAAINIPHYILNFERQFDEQVVSNFVREYTSGRTPLPCAHCNSDLKFATLVERAQGFGADAVATGHYARVERDAVTGRYRLQRGVDPAKDQSYFLFSLTQHQLARAVFPVGDRPKDAVREYARLRQLPVANKPDSQEICFIPDDDYAGFVTTHAADAPRDGVIVDEHGRVLGSHAGIHRFTVGQRKGLGLTSSPTGTPMYVLALRPADQQVVVGPKSSLERTTLTASGVNWIAEEPRAAIHVAAQIRHRHQAAPAAVRTLGDAQAEVVFDTPQIAVTPGQAVVFYDGDVVVGGGWID
ncbi:MAG: tRNA 2-thiouridine(34) synthase MnmA [Acidobacteria bacterium 13_1_40CM_4_65_8]|nr:MAG: tRNA 2-thiouridine(34) synthase MnmA [Acidobacteria bacterium 13_1_40CM_4_65_8]OLE81975.1 MAG: tRNA 2-thiouridine(34) synthase MnmA [Acidobacteria bacterium 13_1_20CM_2_65_9]